MREDSKEEPLSKLVSEPDFFFIIILYTIHHFIIILLYYNIILYHYIILLLNTLLFYIIYTIYPLAKIGGWDFRMEICITSTP